MGHIYAYTDEIKQTHQDDKYNRQIKVGYTKNRPEDRVTQQDMTAQSVPLVLLESWDIGNALIDIHPGIDPDVYVHNMLKHNGHRPSRTDKKREWYTINEPTEQGRLREIRKAIQKAVKNPDAARVKLELTPPQYETIENVHTAIADGRKTILAELCPRFGKTVWAMTILLSSDFDMMIVSTYWLSALSSFKDDVTKFKEFKDLRYVDASDPDFEKQIRTIRRKGLKIIVGVSLYTGSHGRVTKKKDLNFLAKFKNKFLFVDEADFGAWRENQKEINDHMQNGSPIILATGTNGQRAASYYNIDHYIGKTYFDLLVTKGELAKGRKHFKPSIKIGVKLATNMKRIPEVEFYQLAFPNIVTSEIMDSDNLPSWNKVIENPSKAKGFIHAIFGALFNGESSEYEYMALENVFHSDPTGIMIWLPEGGRKDNISKFAKILQPIISEWDVIPLTGDQTTNKEAQELVQNAHAAAIKEGKKGVVVVAMKMGARSFSVPEIDTIILAYDNGSVAQTAQKMSRCLTGYGDARKKIGRVVSLSLDPTREDVMDPAILETAVNIQKTKDIDFEEALRIVLRTLNIFTMNANGDRARINLDEYSKKILSLRSLSKAIAKSADIGIILSDPDMIRQLLQVEVGSFGLGVSDDVIEKGQRFLDKKGKVKKNAKGKNKEEKELLSLMLKIQMAISALCDNAPVMAGMTPHTKMLDVLGCIIEDRCSDLFEVEFGVSPLFVQDLITKRVVSNTLIDLTLSVAKKETDKYIQEFWK